jgi:two-component system, chemotaxis family, chemotaxis protein CheY
MGILVSMLGNVLIVDDSLVARLSLKAILKGTDFDISEAGSGEAALKLLEEGLRPRIVFLDLTMPGKGGIETLRDIKASYPDLPVVVVTADIQARTVEMVRSTGAFAVVRKPAEKAEILSVLDRFSGKGQVA